MTRFLSHLVSGLVGACLCGIAVWVIPAIEPAAVTDDKGAVPVHGIATLTQPGICQYQLRFEGQTKRGDNHPGKSVQFSLMADLGHLHGAPGATEFQFSGVSGFMRADSEEPR